MNSPKRIRLFSKIPRSMKATGKTGSGQFYALSQAAIKKTKLGGLRVTGMKRYMALERTFYYWVNPTWGSTEFNFDPDKEIQFLLWERQDGHYGLILPIISGDLRATLGGGGKELEVHVEGALEGEEPASADLLYTAWGDDPHVLVAEAMYTIRTHLKSFRLREEKRVPEYTDQFGWCTWNAFYKKVNEQKVVKGLKTFVDGGVTPGMLILDDGWQNVRENMFNSFVPNKEKFPKGLGDLVLKCKKMGVETFGVWHALQGYWNGVHPDGELSKEYRVVRNRGPSPTISEGDHDLGLVHPKDIARFYQDFYEYLKVHGVDLVKVDNQSVTQFFTQGKLGRVSTMKAYQYALQGASATHFEGNSIHCMCNSQDVAYHKSTSLGWRNSDDFYPKKPEMQGWHVSTNAINNLWASHFSIPDWDMFQSHHYSAHFHAAARAISGGPVYVSDEPGKQNFELIKKMITSDGRALRCENPALPAKDSIFVNVLEEDRLLKITNHNAEAGMLGLFNCKYQSDDITDTFCADDVPCLDRSKYACYLHEAGTLQIVGRRKKMKISLPELGHEVVTFAPLNKGYAVLGLLDKFNSSRAIQYHGFAKDGSYQAAFVEGGAIGFYSAECPSEIHVNSRKTRFTYNEDTGLLVVKAKTGAPVLVHIYE